jgi:hypothetical protein
MNKQELDDLRHTLNLGSQKDIERIKETLRLTIRVLQAFLDKPDNINMNISIEEDSGTATIDTYSFVYDENGRVKGYAFYESERIYREYAEALRDFLANSGITDYADGDMSYPSLGTFEAIKAAVEKNIRDNEANRQKSEANKVKWQGILERLGDNEQETKK